MYAPLKTDQNVDQFLNTTLFRTNDLDFAEKRIHRLEDEVRDQIVRDDEDGNALNQLKREKREMDHQLEELREELDEALSELERAEQERDRLRVSIHFLSFKCYPQITGKLPIS